MNALRTRSCYGTSWLLLGAALFSACGGAGTLSGKVNVEGGTSSGVAVFIFGPVSGATVTSADGAFAFDKLPDGAYVVRATVRGAEVEEQSAASTVTQGKGMDVMLNFKNANAKITGKVSFSDGSSAQDLTVNVVGPVTAGARTASDGSYSFENLKSGAYTVSVEAPDTREGRVAIGVSATGAVIVPELKLTPIGKIGGTVQYNGMPASGVAISVPGTSITSATDSMGKFTLEGVPAGMQTLSARAGTTPFIRSANVTVVITRGANPDQSITLTDDPPPTGTVTGVVTFHGNRSPKDITVSAVGANAMATPGVNGAFSLTVPVGIWDIVATAPLHAPLTLGRVEVGVGRTVALPGQELSWWRPIWTSQTTINSVSPVTPMPNDVTHSWSLVQVNDPTQRRLVLVNGQTFEWREVAVGTTSSQRVSRTAKYAGWVVNNTAFVYEIATGTITTFNAAQNVSQIEFSTDETVLFILRSGPTLTRITLASPATPLVIPSSGNANGVFFQSVDRWFVQETTDIRLVTPTLNQAQVFTNVASFSVFPTAWALTSCAATCQLRVLGPNATTNVQDPTVAPANGAITAFSGALQSPSTYPCFILNSPLPASAFCVRAADGTHTPLVGVPIQFKLNDDPNGTSRVIFSFLNGANTAIREETFPPNTSTVNLASSTNSWNLGWISPTRAYAVELTGSPRALHLVKSGADTVDTDIGTQGVIEVPPMLVAASTSTSRWRAIIGDGAFRQIDVPTTQSVFSTGVRPLGTGPVTKFGAVAFDQTQMYVIDENTTMVKLSTAGAPQTNTGFRSGTVESMTIVRAGVAQPAFYLFGNGAVLEAFDDTTLQGGIGNSNYIAALGLGADRLTVYGGVFGP